jgi:hypothetical protein
MTNERDGAEAETNCHRLMVVPKERDVFVLGLVCPDTTHKVMVYVQLLQEQAMPTKF